MNDIDDTEIKAEIDGIMKGVKDIMKKIEAVTPKEEKEQEPVDERPESPDSSNTNPAAEK